MTRRILQAITLLLLLLTMNSCFLFTDSTTTTVTTDVTNDSIIKNIEDIKRPDMQLIGKSIEFRKDWPGLDNVIELAENYNHDRTASLQWKDETLALDNNYPSQLNDPVLKARLKVLQTKAGMYHAMINRNSASLAEISGTYDELMIAYDTMIYHLNDFIERKQYTTDFQTEEPEKDN